MPRLTPAELATIAVKNAKPTPKPKLHADKTAEYERRCHTAMLAAARRGKRYCEVEIPGDLYDRLALLLAAYKPSINGDGHTHTVICLRF